MLHLISARRDGHVRTRTRNGQAALPLMAPIEAHGSHQRIETVDEIVCKGAKVLLAVPMEVEPILDGGTTPWSKFAGSGCGGFCSGFVGTPHLAREARRRSGQFGDRMLCYVKGRRNQSEA